MVQEMPAAWKKVAQPMRFSGRPMISLEAVAKSTSAPFSSKGMRMGMPCSSLSSLSRNWTMSRMADSVAPSLLPRLSEAAWVSVMRQGVRPRPPRMVRTLRVMRELSMPSGQ